MYAIASMWDRNLVILPYKSIHKVMDSDSGKNKFIDLCSVFNFSILSRPNSRISCEPFGNNVSLACYPKFRALKRFHNDNDVCFGGKVWGKSGVIPFQQKLDVMNFPPKMIFADAYQNLFSRLVKQLASIGGKNQINPTSQLPPYCVVHWR